MWLDYVRSLTGETQSLSPETLPYQGVTPSAVGHLCQHRVQRMNGSNWIAPAGSPVLIREEREEQCLLSGVPILEEKTLCHAEFPKYKRLAISN